MADKQQTDKPAPQGAGGDSAGTSVNQGGTRGAANAMGRHSKEADHSPGSVAEPQKAKGTEKAKD